MKKGGLKNCTLIVSNDEGEAKKKTCFAAAFFGREEITGSNWPHVAPSQSFFPWQSTTIKVQFVVFPRSFESYYYSLEKCAVKYYRWP